MGLTKSKRMIPCEKAEACSFLVIVLVLPNTKIPICSWSHCVSVYLYILLSMNEIVSNNSSKVKNAKNGNMFVKEEIDLWRVLVSSKSEAFTHWNPLYIFYIGRVKSGFIFDIRVLLTRSYNKSLFQQRRVLKWRKVNMFNNWIYF